MHLMLWSLRWSRKRTLASRTRYAFHPHTHTHANNINICSIVGNDENHGSLRYESPSTRPQHHHHFLVLNRSFESTLGTHRHYSEMSLSVIFPCPFNFNSQWFPFYDSVQTLDQEKSTQQQQQENFKKRIKKRIKKKQNKAASCTRTVEEFCYRLPWWWMNLRACSKTWY